MSKMSNMIREYFDEILVPICVDQYISNSELDLKQYPPFFDDKSKDPNYSVFVEYLEARGYFYNSDDKKYYSVDRLTGIFNECDEDGLNQEIYALWKHHTSGRINLKKNDVSSILLQFRSMVLIKNLPLIRFLETDLGSKYDVDNDYFDPSDPLGHRKPKDVITAFKNGLFNTKLEEMLPHCGILFSPHPFDHSLSIIPKEKIEDSDILKEYLSIFSDRDTFNYYLYWVGSLFFDERPLKTILHIIGESDSGKTLVSEVLQGIIGGYGAKSVRIDELLGNHGLSVVENKRLIITSEAGKKNKTASDLFKVLSGQQSIVVNPKFEKQRSISLDLRWIVCGNNYLNTDLSDHGIINRIEVIRFKKGKITKSRGRYLYGLFNSKEGRDWLVSAAYYSWKEHWYDDPDDLVSYEMKLDHDRMFSYDPFNGWVISTCGSLEREIVGPFFHKRSYTTLYEDFVLYCRSEEADILKKSEWGKQMMFNFNLVRKTTSGSSYLFYDND